MPCPSQNHAPLSSLYKEILKCAKSNEKIQCWHMWIYIHRLITSNTHTLTHLRTYRHIHTHASMSVFNWNTTSKALAHQVRNWILKRGKLFLELLLIRCIWGKFLVELMWKRLFERDFHSFWAFSTYQIFSTLQILIMQWSKERQSFKECISCQNIRDNFFISAS